MSRFIRRPRRWLVLTAVGAVVAAVSFPPVYADDPSGCDFAPNGSTLSCLPPLSGSTFEGGDGNLLVNTTGNTDWVNAPGFNKGIDLASGTTDNAFGQGT